MMSIPDPRHLSNGNAIPSEGYADQPYIVQTDDGAWLCIMTTVAGREGAHGQHIVSLRSTDRGQTWEPPVDVEPSDGPEASYAVLLKVPYGRIYCFYNHNTDNVREVRTEDGGIFSRVDSLGNYVYKYSDDHGRSWSAQRYVVPVREFACDRENVYGGALRFFWNVGRPLVHEHDVLLTLHKVGAMGAGFFAQSEGVLLRSANILTEHDPARITFETLPDGDIGLRTPPGGGRVAEEHSVTVLRDGSLCCVYRTVDGWPVVAYSRDGGHTWTEPAYLTYAPGARRVKHPRAATFIWRCANGRFLYWFHQHGGHFIRSLGGHASLPNGLAADNSATPYDDRNPVWLMAAREVETAAGLLLEFTQPEILLYDDDPYIRMSYPDLVEEDGQYWVSETQKHVARVHAIPAELIQGLFAQWDAAQVTRTGLLLELASPPLPAETLMLRLPDFSTRDTSRFDMAGIDLRAGFTLELVLTLDTLASGQVLLDSRTEAGRGLTLQTTEQGTLAICLHDGRSEQRWDTDPGALCPGIAHHVTFIVDGGPKIISVLVDGILGDGGEARQFGWGRFSPHLYNVTGGTVLRLAESVSLVRLYGRALRTSEAVGNYRAGQRSSAGDLAPDTPV
jgi:hypothetical protein